MNRHPRFAFGLGSPRRPEFLHGSVVSYQPEGRIGAVFMSEEAFPNILGHRLCTWGLPPGYLTGLSK